MRTTVTLDPDVVAELKELARQRGVSFKEVLNDAVRAGLAAGTTARTYRLPTARLELRPGVSLDGALRLAAAMEDEETVRKLELRK
jgi:Ribbon-helix-helix protein, copG family